VLSFAIPDDTFHDPEDGDTSNLHLVFMTFADDPSDGHESVTPLSWIQLNATSRTLYGLPLSDDVGRRQYLFTAADSSGNFDTMAFEVDVTESRLAQQLSHEFTVLLDLNYQQFLYKVSHSHACYW